MKVDSIEVCFFATFGLLAALFLWPLESVGHVEKREVKNENPSVAIQPTVDSESPRNQRESNSPIKGASNPVQQERPLLFGKCLDPNTASHEALVDLPGIGPALAKRIIAYRAKRTFQQPSKLRRVKGIGRVKLRKIRPYICIKK